jgi:cell wall-associated NlpC family hydrolase
MPHSYRGRHLAPSTASVTSRRVAAAAAVPVTAMGLGVANAGTASAAVVSTELSLGPASRTVAYDATVRFTSVLSTKLGPLVHQEVGLYERRGRASSWHRVGQATTDRQGHVAFTETHLTRTEQWQVRFAGDRVLDPASSPVRTITVPPPPSSVLGRKAVEEAARHAGAPYKWGAAGPDEFDCSGLTKYVYGRLGVSLPHNAQAQYDAVRHVSRADLRPGDLVFFYGSDGSVYHVGIYAGHGEMWNAPHSGAVVRREALFSDAYHVGRVR